MGNRGKDEVQSCSRDEGGDLESMIEIPISSTLWPGVGVDEGTVAQISVPKVVTRASLSA
jgi:hypothetical protein